MMTHTVKTSPQTLDQEIKRQGTWIEFLSRSQYRLLLTSFILHHC